MLRAAWTNVRRGGKVEGASTITQQLARSLFLSSERTFDRKVREFILAYKMELVLTKEQILELYLNQIYFGQGAYGVASAAQTYFGKDLSALTVGESAFLAGLPKSPNHYSPFKAYDRAKKRQEHVLARMEEAKFLTTAEREQAAAEILNFRRPGAEQAAPYFVEYIRQMLVAKYGEAMVYKGGLKVFTTLNMEMQKAAEAAFAAGLRELDKRQGWRGPLRTVDVTAPAPPIVAAATDQALKVGDYREGFMPELRIKDVRMPELRLPEMTRQDISKALGEVRRDIADASRDIADASREIDLSKVDLSKVEFPKVDISRKDVSKAFEARPRRSASVSHDRRSVRHRRHRDARTGRMGAAQLARDPAPTRRGGQGP